MTSVRHVCYPPPSAQSAVWVRAWRSSFVKMCSTWTRAVVLAIASEAPISLFEQPRAGNESTSRLRGVSGAELGRGGTQLTRVGAPLAVCG